MNSSQQAIHAQINSGLLSAICFLLPFMQTIRSVPFLSYVIAILILNWIISGKIFSSFSSLTRNLPAVLLLSLYLLYLLGLISTENEANAVRQLLTKLPLIIFPMIISTSSFTRKQLDNCLKWFVLGCISAALVIMGVAGYSKLLHGGNKFYYVLLSSPLHMHPSYLASFFITAVVVTIHFIYDSKNKFISRSNLFAIVIICFLTISVILLSARAQVIALLSISIAYSAAIAIRLKQYLLALSVPLILFLSLLVTYQTSESVRFRFEKGFDEIMNFGNPIDKNHFAGRAEVWQASSEVVSEHFWMGVGTGDVSDAMNEKYLGEEFKYALEKNFNAHNQFLQTWMALGVGGFVLLLMIFAIPFYLAVRKKVFPAMAFLGLMFISFQTESMLEAQSGTVFFCLFFSLFAVYMKDEKIKDS